MGPLTNQVDWTFDPLLIIAELLYQLKNLLPLRVNVVCEWSYSDVIF